MNESRVNSDNMELVSMMNPTRAKKVNRTIGQLRNTFTDLAPRTSSNGLKK